MTRAHSTESKSDAGRRITPKKSTNLSMADNGEAGWAGPKRLTSVFTMDTLSQESKCDSRTTRAAATTRQPMASGSELPEIGALVEALGG